MAPFFVHISHAPMVKLVATIGLRSIAQWAWGFESL
jgi:hypothetical protein